MPPSSFTLLLPFDDAGWKNYFASLPIEDQQLKRLESLLEKAEKLREPPLEVQQIKAPLQVSPAWRLTTQRNTGEKRRKAIEALEQIQMEKGRWPTVTQTSSADQLPEATSLHLPCWVLREGVLRLQVQSPPAQDGLEDWEPRKTKVRTCPLLRADLLRARLAIVEGNRLNQAFKQLGRERPQQALEILERGQAVELTAQETPTTLWEQGLRAEALRPLLEAPGQEVRRRAFRILKHFGPVRPQSLTELQSGSRSTRG